MFKDEGADRRDPETLLRENQKEPTVCNDNEVEETENFNGLKLRK